MKSIMKKRNLLIIIGIIIILVIIFSGKSKDKDNVGNNKEIDYIPEQRESLSSSLDLEDIENDINVKLDFPTNEFNL